MRHLLCGLTLVGVFGCNSEKRVDTALLKQYYECVTVAGPATGEPNARLEACLMSKGWSHDSASAMSGNWNEVLVAARSPTTQKTQNAGGFRSLPLDVASIRPAR